MIDIWPHDESPRFAPIVVTAANSNYFIKRDDDLDRMVRVRGDNSLGGSEQQKAAVPKEPAWRA
jgi:hypothetical protein